MSEVINGLHGNDSDREHNFCSDIFNGRGLQMSWGEFTHYSGCRNQDPDNCSACALLNAGEEGPNYAAWPLSFIQSGRAIPQKYFKALIKETKRTDNKAYVNNLKTKLKEAGYDIAQIEANYGTLK